MQNAGRFRLIIHASAPPLQPIDSCALLPTAPSPHLFEYFIRGMRGEHTISEPIWPAAGCKADRTTCGSMRVDAR